MRKQSEACTMCKVSFTMVTFLGMGKKDFYCQRCGNAVCEKCS